MKYGVSLVLKISELEKIKSALGQNITIIIYICPQSKNDQVGRETQYQTPEHYLRSLIYNIYSGCQEASFVYFLSLSTLTSS